MTSTPTLAPAQSINIIDLSASLGAKGLAILGGSSGDNSGYSVSEAGDVNGDGYDDIIMGAWQAQVNSRGNAGTSYVIYGGINNPGTIDLSIVLTSMQGFAILGGLPSPYGETSGNSVSGAGDINGDGYADIIVGAVGLSFSSGAAYVIYGSASNPGTIDLSVALTNSQGFSMFGKTLYVDTGYSVSGAGDINGDGYADIIVSAPYILNSIGESYVIYGNSNNPGTIDLSIALTSTQGFSIYGGTTGDNSGWSVSGAGDINNDGYADIIIGAVNAKSKAGESYVIYGSSSNPGTIDLSLALTSTQGFAILGGAVGDQSGVSVSTAGDVNGDGYADIIIGALGASPNSRTNAGKSYVIYGNASCPGIIDLSVALTSTQGFAILGGAAGDQSGVSVSSAGDVNNDGYADIIIGARYASPSSRTNAGESYIIYGSSYNPGTIDLLALSSSQGFSIFGGKAFDYSGYSVSNAGDVNGDKYDYIIIGAYGAYPEFRSGAGESYVIYGSASPTPVPTKIPTMEPTIAPTFSPTALPTSPTFFPTTIPIISPSSIPTAVSTFSPTAMPTIAPTATPTLIPTSILATTHPTAPITLENGLVASYPFNGNANDESGNGNNGIVHSAVLSTDRFGNSSSSYTFNGVSSYIEITNGIAFNFVNDFSISVWINPTSSQVTYAEIYSKSHDSYNGFECEQQTSNTNYFCSGYYYTSGHGEASCIQFIANNWNHFVFTKQNAIASYYLDGALKGVTTAPSTGVITAADLPLLFGAWNSGHTSPASGVTRYYNGAIDDIYIYNRTLSNAEVQQFYSMNSYPTFVPTALPTGPTFAPTLIPTTAPTAINLVVNGGAETGTMEGWVTSGWCSGCIYYSPHTGIYSFFSWTGTMSQNISVTTGATYEVSFWAGGGGSLAVNISNNILMPLLTMTGYYSEYNFNFIASNALETILFYSYAPYGMNLDDISVISVPAPTTSPTKIPTFLPTFIPTVIPSTIYPTTIPTAAPTAVPTATPTNKPTSSPTSLIKYCNQLPVCPGSSASENFIITTSIDQQIISGGGNDVYTIATITSNSVVLTIQGFTSTGVIDLTYFTNVHSMSDLHIYNNPSNIVLPNGETVELPDYSNTLNAGNFKFYSAPGTTGTTTNNNAASQLVLKGVVGGLSTIFGIVAGWFFREKIAFSVLKNWGHSYKLMYDNTYDTLGKREIGLTTKKIDGEDKLVIVLNKANTIKFHVVIIDNHNNNHGISASLNRLIIDELQNQHSSRFELKPSEQNQLLDFLTSHKHIKPEIIFNCYFHLTSYTELGYARGFVYNIFLKTYKSTYIHHCKEELFKSDNDIEMSKIYDHDKLEESYLNIQDVQMSEMTSTIKDENPIAFTTASNGYNKINSQGKFDSQDILQDTSSIDNRLPEAVMSSNLEALVGTKENIVVFSIYNLKFDNPEIDRIYHSRLAKFDDKITAAAKEVKEPIKLITEYSVPGSHKDTSSFTPSTVNPLMMPLLEVRNAIEYLPLIKYVADMAYPLVSAYLPESAQNFTLPAILDSKSFLFTAHLTVGHLGAMLLPAESVNSGLVVSTAGSAAFGMRLAASHCLSEQRQDIANKDMDGFEVAKYCAATMLAYTVPSLATCAIANFIMPGSGCSVPDLGTKISLSGAECYSMYKSSTKAVETPTTADAVMPYIADGIALVASCASGGSEISVVSAVVTTDYLTRVAMDMVPSEAKASYIDPAFNFIHVVGYNVYQEANDFINCIANKDNIMGCFATISSTQEL